jgi:hypothetical protein
MTLAPSSADQIFALLPPAYFQRYAATPDDIFAAAFAAPPAQCRHFAATRWPFSPPLMRADATPLLRAIFDHRRFMP